jgi:hypothetical protein
MARGAAESFNEKAARHSPGSDRPEGAWFLGETPPRARTLAATSLSVVAVTSDHG